MKASGNLRAQLQPVLRLLSEGAADGTWRKCIVTPSRQAARFVPWDKFVAQPVRLAKGPAVKLVTRSGTRESTATLSLEQWPDRLEEAIEAGPCNLDVLTPAHDWHARRTRDGRWLVTRSRPSIVPPSASPAPDGPRGHDRAPQHPLSPENERARQLFIETGLFGKNGRPLGEAAAKYRQVQHYIELIRHLPVWEKGEVRVVDAGCGKAYLSLALCLWAELRGVRVRLTGVDSSPEVVETVTGIAERLGLANATFRKSTIAEFAAGTDEPVDLLLSLHACDTATDEALAAGVRRGAGALVLVPCCHQELSDQIAQAGRAGSLQAATRWAGTLRSGLLQHRLADIITDSLRATALEALGYAVDVLEFVSPEATARNLMIRASLRQRPNTRGAARALEGYRALAGEWGVHPALEGLLGPLWPPQAAI